MQIIPNGPGDCGCGTEICDIQSHNTFYRTQRLAICGDCIHGDKQLMCPVHYDVVLWTFACGWWEQLGGSFEHNPMWRTYCPQCRSYYLIETWSYRG